MKKKLKQNCSILEFHRTHTLHVQTEPCQWTELNNIRVQYYNINVLYYGTHGARTNFKV